MNRPQIFKAISKFHATHKNYLQNRKKLVPDRQLRIKQVEVTKIILTFVSSLASNVDLSQILDFLVPKG
jgi:hypothetical protein